MRFKKYKSLLFSYENYMSVPILCKQYNKYFLNNNYNILTCYTSIFPNKTLIVSETLKTNYSDPK